MVITEKAPGVTIARCATLTLKTVGLTLTILMGGDIKGIWVLIHINFQNHRSQVSNSASLEFENFNFNLPRAERTGFNFS